MSVIATPSGLIIAECSFGQARYDQVELSDATGHAAARIFGPPRWRVSIRSHQALPLAQAAIWDAMLLQLRGGINHLSFGDPVRKVPLGTMRGTLTLNGAHSAGAVSLSVTGGAGQASTTLKTGDWLQIGTGLGTSQLVKVMADATANGSGVIALTIEPPLRTAFSGGAAVTWNAPIGYFKQTSEPLWNYAPGRSAGGFAADLLESWT
jgi:hypothetical protein